MVATRLSEITHKHAAFVFTHYVAKDSVFHRIRQQVEEDVFSLKMHD